MNEEKMCKLPVKIMDQILAYLGKKSYIEVSHLINVIHTNTTVIEDECENKGEDNSGKDSE